MPCTYAVFVPVFKVNVRVLPSEPAFMVQSEYSSQVRSASFELNATVTVGVICVLVIWMFLTLGWMV